MVTVRLQYGSTQATWKLKTSQFLSGPHTHQTCPPVSMFGLSWIDVYSSVFHFLPQDISCNISQLHTDIKVDKHLTGYNY